MRAIETTGHFDKPGFLKLDNKLDLNKKKKLKIIILINEDDDIDESLWLKAMSSNPSLDFLKNPKEDIYSLSDGKALKK